MQAFCVSNVCNILLPRVLMRVFTRAVCLEEGYNIVAARSQKPIPPAPESLYHKCTKNNSKHTEIDCN